MIDWTQIILAVVGGIISIIGIVATALINNKLQNKADAEALSSAVKNSLGAIQQAVDHGVVAITPKTTIPGISPEMAVGVQYTLDHAGDEAKRLGITPEAIASKINAQIGLQTIAEKTAAAPVQAALVPLTTKVSP